MEESNTEGYSLKKMAVSLMMKNRKPTAIFLSGDNSKIYNRSKLLPKLSAFMGEKGTGFFDNIIQGPDQACTCSDTKRILCSSASELFGSIPVFGDNTAHSIIKRASGDKGNYGRNKKYSSRSLEASCHQFCINRGKGGCDNGWR